jgi:hypothetical protein
MQEYQGSIAAFTVAAPLVVEGTILAKNIFNNPRFPIEKAIELKNRLIQAFIPQKDETLDQSILRISKNVFLLIAFLALSAAALYLTIQFLPVAAASPGIF